MPTAPRSPDEKKRLAAVQKIKMFGTPAEERFDKITRLARIIYGVPMAALNIVGEKAAWLKSVQGFKAVDALPENTYCNYTVLTKGICLIRDARNDPRVSDSEAVEKWVFYAGVPLHLDGQRVGALCIGDNKPRDFTEDELSSLYDLAALAEYELAQQALSEAQIELAQTHEELENKSLIDEVTHLWNSEAIINVLNAELAKATIPLISVLLIDLDFFTHVNETYGNVTGDEMLIKASEIFRKVLDAKYAIGRIGDDKFLVVLSSVDNTEATLIGKQICDEIARKPLIINESQIVMTCSVGCVTFRTQTTAVEIMKQARQTLQSAKSAGKNRVNSDVIS